MKRNIRHSMKNITPGRVARSSRSSGVPSQCPEAVKSKHEILPGRRWMALVACLLAWFGPLNANAQHSIRGRSEVAKLGAVVNFKQLAQREFAKSTKSARRQIPYMRGPGARPVPAGVVLPPAGQPQKAAP